MNDSLSRLLQSENISLDLLKESRQRPGTYQTTIAGGDPSVRTLGRLQRAFSETGYWPILRGEMTAEEIDEISLVDDAIDTAGALARVPSGTVVEILAKRLTEDFNALQDDYIEEKTSDRTPWPVSPGTGRRLQLAFDYKGRPLRRCGLMLVEVSDPADLPAHVGFGGWNECPTDEIHVAVFRRWKERFGATIASMSHDVIECFVEHPPETEAEAMLLAREHFMFCEDIVTQGTESIRQLAIELWQSPQWYFWWD